MKDSISATGRTRYRLNKRLFRKPLLVLQIEFRMQGTHLDEDGFGPSFDILRWRDASLEDFTTKLKSAEVI